MKDIFDNKFTDQVSLTYDYLVPEVSSYLQINEIEIEDRNGKIIPRECAIHSIERNFIEEQIQNELQFSGEIVGI